MPTRTCDQLMKKFAKSPRRAAFRFLFGRYRFAILNLLGPLVRTRNNCIDAARAKKCLIKENHLFSFEYMTHTNLPDRPGNPVSITIEGNHIVTSRGVEFLHPPNERIFLRH